ncbi:hypothetical protein [Pseudomonas sp. S32]|uniref:hypothetical protein n=1 Tax=Pseudomonas sp. S32 TaxID=2767448 RepID=UPI001914A420|nr:hypothetical protein [Pseudomonas sp. S32]MBK5005277.1 hypothetical protein [Pseudomonas sp. S32]
MNIDKDMEQVARDAQVVMLLTVFAGSAVTEPNFNKAEYLARIEGSLVKMEKAEPPFDPDLVKAARIVLQALRDHGGKNGKS